MKASAFSLLTLKLREIREREGNQLLAFLLNKEELINFCHTELFCPGSHLTFNNTRKENYPKNVDMSI